VFWIRIGVSANPDPDAAFDLKLVPDPGNHANADPELVRLRGEKKLNFLHEKARFAHTSANFHTLLSNKNSYN
jgi:hypothetical protein